MKITKRQLRRIIKEEFQQTLNEAPDMTHPYFQAADEYWDRYESRTDTVDTMLEDVVQVLGAEHKLSKKINKMTRKGSPDLYDVATMIDQAIKNSVPVDLLDRLHALNSFELDDDDE